MNKLVILTGPTAVGKTHLSIQLAKKINGEIISADSIQVYKGMDIGSAKITKEETDGIPHHLIDILEPKEEFNVHIFKKLATKAINDISSRGKIPIIVGGTGFYIQAVLYDINFDDTETDYEYREYLEQLAKDKGNAFLHNMLKEVDPESAAAIHCNNLKRVIRALEYYKQTGKKISEHNEKERENKSPYNFAYFVLNDKRDKLYNRINQRVDIMFDNGLLKEMETLIAKGYTRDLVSMQGIGYKELFNYFDGKTSLDETKELIKKNTRHFAKRQLTWFRREKDVTMLNIDEFNYDRLKVLNEMLNFLKNKEII
jgi:tRNA dimethylallyltransferase